jgi:hypothetical protein
VQILRVACRAVHAAAGPPLEHVHLVAFSGGGGAVRGALLLLLLPLSLENPEGKREARRNKLLPSQWLLP